MDRTYRFTHQLMYGHRREIFKLLDADKSWQELGGRYMGLDGTELALVEQAIIRNASPTEVLFQRLDSSNAEIRDLCYYLEQMNHFRALEILKPYLISGNNSAAPSSKQSIQQSADISLYTPTPSFSGIQPVALMSPSEFDIVANNEDFSKNPNDWNFLTNSKSKQDINNDSRLGANQANQRSQPPATCHRSNNNKAIMPITNGHTTNISNTAAKDANHEQNCVVDPGEEIVRLACTKNMRKTSFTDQNVVNQLRLTMQISYDELKTASDNFAETNILGNGGFASVYRGQWKGTEVAIKRLRCNLMDQAFNELTILNSHKIDNILPIYGISIDGPEACLVYQFMANGSLEDRLACKNGTRPLTWDQRVMIAEGVAKGLNYLHTVRKKPLVHGDAKSANVLLDSQFVPKLGDFGLARQVFQNRNPQTEICTSCTVTSINGTSVYLPDEYKRHKILSPAVDVFSYGIVLLEMATGKRAYDGKQLLYNLIEDENEKVKHQQTICWHLQDPRLSNNIGTNCGLVGVGGDIRFELLLKLGIICADKIKKKRPTMSQVLSHFAQFKSYLANNPSIPFEQPQQQQQHQLQAPIYNFTNMRHNNTSLIPSTTTAATTRTLTPELTAQDSYKQQQQQIPLNVNPNYYYNQNQQQQQYQVNDGAFMSVDDIKQGVEVQQQPDYQQYQQQKQYQMLQQQQQQQPLQQQQPYEGGVSVEAMIPLLSELWSKKSIAE